MRPLAVEDPPRKHRAEREDFGAEVHFDQFFGALDMDAGDPHDKALRVDAVQLEVHRLARNAHLIHLYGPRRRVDADSVET